MPSTWESLEVDGNDMQAYVSRPAGSGPFPGILLVHQGNYAREILSPGARTGPGVDQFARDMGDRLASEGYLVAAPDLYHRMDESTIADGSTRPVNLTDWEIEADINATVEYLRNPQPHKSGKLGIMGFGFGGRIAWLMAAANPHFKAVVVYYGGAIMLPKAEKALDVTRPGGRGNIFKPEGSASRTPFERTSEIGCPVMFHVGDEDQNPTQAEMAKLDAELTRLDKPHQFFTYHNAGHHFMDHTGERYVAEAAEASWPRTLQFFGRHLK